MRYLLIVAVGIFLVGCSKKKLQELGDIRYDRLGDVCTDDKKHWLLDIEATNANDSVYLDSRVLGRKVEINSKSLDTTSHLYKLLAETCKEDSLYLELSAAQFYGSLKGMVPSYLSDSERIHVNVWMRDKLTAIGYVSFKQTFEQQVMASYTQQNRWNARLDTATQIYYEVLKKNNSKQDQFSKAKVNYVLKSLNEQVIAHSKDGDPFIYDVNDKAIIGGIQFLANTLKVGESARALVPSNQAFGASGNLRVPGYTPILLELEVLEHIR
jgi:hypothetical protein